MRTPPEKFGGVTTLYSYGNGVSDVKMASVTLDHPCYAVMQNGKDQHEDRIYYWL
jgi:hypothetical protein